jgi:hypothetical protein
MFLQSTKNRTYAPINVKSVVTTKERVAAFYITPYTRKKAYIQ